MSAAERINGLVPVFNWAWWQIFIFVMVLGWGVLHLLKWLDPPHKKTPHWWSALYGDILLPVGIASSAVITRSFEYIGAWYTSRWWNWLVLASGVVTILIIELLVVYKIRGEKNRHQLFSVSNIYHVFIFPAFFYLSVMTIIPMFVTRKPQWAFALAIIGYSGWALTALHDTKWPPKDKSANFITWLRLMLRSN